ncbi:Kynurenine--oxoglutarate transaminase 1 [Sesamum angolense]|uniref:Kynurenine--oxoglutarate transaminase 1 n=1 Tax=Sesamum angolense TaxID=2727404 RepID=A0AAE1X8R1_9LAMI|nr:Kynurenine--oxoglutarate transaminase 1 [Sesamum angolense]
MFQASRPNTHLLQGEDKATAEESKEKMEAKLSSLAKTLTPSSIQQLSYLAQRCNAVNLAEGFPDFPAPIHIKDAAVSAILADFNQYSHVQGTCDYVARKTKEMHGMNVDPLTDIVICCGQSEAFAATMFSIIDQGMRLYYLIRHTKRMMFVLGLLEEFLFLMGGGKWQVYVGLDPPQWTLNSDKLEKSFTEKTKALVLNSPHNPTGKVFNKDELEIIAGACQRRDVVAVTDEVYEHITFDNQSHISLASLPGMQRRTVITSSLSKTFSVTGWRIGWAIAPTCIASAVRNIHIRMTDCAPVPFQEAALAALRSPPAYFDRLRRDYESKRDCIFNLLAKVGFKMQFKPQEFVEELIKQAGVVAVPGAGFFHSKPSAYYASTRYIRFAFCKSEDTLAAASLKISRLVDASGNLKLFLTC